MTTPANWMPPAEPAGTPDAPPPAPRRHRLTLIIFGTLAVLAVIAVTVAITLSMTGDRQPAAAASQDPPRSVFQAEDAPTVPPTTAPAPAPTPAAADVHLTLKVTDKQCFGSAGCNITAKVILGYDGPTLDPDETWEITYEITGPEDGPQIGSTTLTGDTYQQNEEDFSTRSSKTKLKIKVTDVAKVGL